ncbi:Spore maturation protein A [Planctomycetes bacterium MalM25]|nr:Spore maturation protein A [Planctomycetes bacterium MalM25]
MLNRIWFWLIVIGVLYAPVRSVVRPLVGFQPELIVAEEGAEPREVTLSDLGKRVTESAIDGANVAVDLLLSLIGIMVLWLGLMQVAKDAGLIDALAWLLRPLMRWLFPEVPEGHPAQGAMLMNISANVLGLDNAATPFGLAAMKELQELNPDKETATNAMATFLAINTSSVTLVPISVIGYRIAAGSDNPAGPLAYIMLATLVSTLVAIIAVRTLAKLPAFAINPAASGAAEEEEL